MWTSPWFAAFVAATAFAVGAVIDGDDVSLFQTVPKKRWGKQQEESTNPDATQTHVVRDGAGDIAENVAEDSTDAVKALVDSLLEKSGISMDEDQAAGVASMMISIMENSIAEYSSPAALLGFFMGNKGNIKQALRQHKMAAAWRRNYPGSIRNLMKEYSPSDYYTDDEVRSSEGCTDMYSKEPSSAEAKVARKYVCLTRLQQTNKAGESINVMSIEPFLKSGLLNHMEFVERAATAFLEDAYQCWLSTSRGKGHTIVDLKDVGFTSVSQVPKVKMFLSLFQKYPPLTQTTSIINAPKVSAAIYKLILPLIPPADRDLIRFTDGGFDEELGNFSNIELATLPKRLGGEASDDDLCVFGGETPIYEIPADEIPTTVPGIPMRSRQRNEPDFMTQRNEPDFMTWDVSAEDADVVQHILEEPEESGAAA